MVCAAVFGMHVVCASTRVWSLPGGLFPSQQEAEYSFLGFILTNKQTKSNLCGACSRTLFGEG